MRYARPETVPQAVALLSGGTRVLAGGTDLYPSSGADLSGDVLDLTAIPDLRGITRTATGLRIGACTTWSEIAETDLPPALTALQQAARQVGGRQIQNAGTIGGNLCNASPAADGVPPLLALDALVELEGPGGKRTLPLSDFLHGPRRTDLRPAEVLTAVTLPAAALSGTSAFLKLGARAHLVISIAMVAARITLEQGRIVQAALAVGACGPVARRLPTVEAALLGLTPEGAAAKITAEAVGPHLSPLDDIRASAAYRVEAAAELLRRAVRGAA
jgi:CO/xanthine dehydrogenase FAD-binding subunit